MNIKVCDACERPLQKRYWKLMVNGFEKVGRSERYVKGEHQTFTVCEKCLERIMAQVKTEAETDDKGAGNPSTADAVPLPLGKGGFESEQA